VQNFESNEETDELEIPAFLRKKTIWAEVRSKK
jgi:hypothetical protein